jgi:protease secretion system outer membrane protein
MPSTSHSPTPLISDRQGYSSTGILPTVFLRTRWLAALACVFAANCHAYSLVQAYQDAAQNDATYRGAKYENEAGQENKTIARSNLLPSLALNYSKNKNRADYTTQSAFGTNTSHPEYDSSAANLSLRQPVLNLDGVARYRQGVAQAQASEAQLTSRHHDLMVRVVSAYLDLLFSDDQLALAVAQRDTLLEQKKVNERLFAKGEGTRTDVLETQARLDLAEAQVVETRDAQSLNRSNLKAIVGHDVGQLDGLGKEFNPMPLQPAEFEAWRDLALKNNPELQAQQYGIEVARQEVTRSKAGHAPRLDFVANYAKNSSESITTLNQDSTIRSIGFQFSMPLYSGGGVNASTRQAAANYQRSKADLDARMDRVLNDLQHQHSVVVSSVARLDALMKAVESAKALIVATQQSIKGGVRINLDLLNARQQYFSAQRDLAQARYNYVQAYMHLRAASGTLAREDLNKLAGYFVGK